MVLRGQISKGWENGQKAGPIEIKVCAICSDGSGNGHRLKNIGPVRHRREHFNLRLTGGNIRGFKGSTFHRKCGYKNYYNIKKIKLINITMLQPSRAKPGNPEL